jgi:hypothetical protein
VAMHRDSPGIEPEPAEGDRTEAPRRFQRLVEASAIRRLALPRLTLAICVGLSAVGFFLFLGSWIIRSVAGYVASLPDQQLPFSKIELVPEPGPWIKIGKAGILEQVRLESKRGESLNLLDVDLKELKNDFLLHSPWVERVDRIERAPRGLIVRLDYRRTVAVVVLKEPGVREILYVIDDHAVPLEARQIEWKSTTDPYRVNGMDEPLIQIWGVDHRSKPTFGVPWKCVSEDGKPGEPDLMVLKAARIAEFLQRQPKTTPSGRPGPKMTQILMPEGPNHSFFLKDQGENLICWGKPPGDEEPGELTSEARWKMLLDRFDRHEPIESKTPNYLYFTKDGVRVGRFVNPSK